MKEISDGKEIQRRQDDRRQTARGEVGWWSRSREEA